MLLISDKGHYFNVVEDFDDPSVLWARSQDRQSINHAAAYIAAVRDQDVPVIDQPTWDYQFRISVSREEWSDYLAYTTEELSATKTKPAVAAARGHNHPVYKAVEDVFYRMSYDRPDGSKPAWVTGGTRAK